MSAAHNTAVPCTQIIIWDDHQGKAIGELCFKAPVRAVRLRRDRIVVALEHKVGGASRRLRHSQQAEHR